MGTESRIALQTAQALIKGGTQGRVRVLFDSGSHRSFVTAKAALKYELPVERKEWITISTFGQKGKESGLREVVRFDIIEDVSINNEYEYENDLKLYSYSKSLSQLSMLAVTPSSSL